MSRQLVIIAAILVASLAGGCFAPVTNFVLAPDSPFDAPHHVLYDGPGGTTSIGGAWVDVSLVTWSNTSDPWTLEGELRLTTPDGTEHQTDTATLATSTSGSADELHTRESITADLSGLTLGNAAGTEFTLNGNVTIEGQVESAAYSGPATLHAEELSVLAPNAAALAYAGTLGATPATSRILHGATVLHLEFEAQDLQVRDTSVDGQVALLLLEGSTVIRTPDGTVSLDAQLAQLYTNDKPRLGCRVELQDPAPVTVRPGEESIAILELRVVGPGAAIDARLRSGGDDRVSFDYGTPRPAGTSFEQSNHLRGFVEGGTFDLVAGVDFILRIKIVDHPGNERIEVPTTFKAINCPDQTFTVTLVPE